jgi:hypothetical protein
MSEFSDIVEQTFGDLARLQDFEMVEQGRTAATFRSQVCEITFSHDDQRSFEVFVGIRLLNRDLGPDFSIDEIARATSVPLELRPQGYAAQGSEQARKLLERVTSILSIYGQPLLRGDSEAWASLISQRDSDCIRYEEETSLRQSLQRADEAWKARDYAKVAALLRTVRHLLGKSDRARLDYSEKQLPGPQNRH